MKSKIKLLAVLLLLGTTSIVIPDHTQAQQGNVSFQVFYDQLSPYGQWINNPNYGYVWLPNAGPDFSPYSTAGHWIYTEYGWTWVSDYSWGWAPFHYGRWDYDSFYGWMWVPDNEWGPSWVTWRRGNGYYGWEPMGPGITVNMSFGRTYSSHNDHWMFVRDRDFERSDVNHYYVNRNEHTTIITNTVIINKTYIDSKRRTTYVAGPSREDVQKGTGRKINQVAIQENSTPGQVTSNGQLRIYRPVVTRTSATSKNPAPIRVVNVKDVKKYTERNPKNQSQVASPSVYKPERQPMSVKPSKNYETKTQSSQTPVTKQVNRNKNPQQNNATVTPNSKPSNYQPVRKETTNPTNNNTVKSQPVRQNNVNPSNNNNVKSQPVLQNNANPSNNNNVRSQPVRQNNTAPSNNNMNKSQPVRQNNAAPSNNQRREQPKETQEKK